jgi:hypothetical protein
LRQLQGAPDDIGDLKKIVGIWNKKKLYKDEVDEYSASRIVGASLGASR